MNYQPDTHSSDKPDKSPTQQKWEGRWDQLVGKVKETWAEITDDEIKRSKGSYRKLIGAIKERTGQTREEIEDRLDDDKDTRH